MEHDQKLFVSSWFGEKLSEDRVDAYVSEDEALRKFLVVSAHAADRSILDDIFQETSNILHLHYAGYRKSKNPLWKKANEILEKAKPETDPQVTSKEMTMATKVILQPYSFMAGLLIVWRLLVLL